MRVVTAALVSAIGFVSVSVPAWAQSSTVPVSRLVPELSVGAARLMQRPSSDATDHFVTSAATLVSLADWNRALARQSAGYPMGPSTGGVVSMGSGGEAPILLGGFLESPWTRGQGRMAFGFGHQGVTFDSYDGIDLRDSGTNIFLAHACCSNTLADRDLMQQTIALRLHRKTTTFTLLYGLSDRVDVGIVLPFVEMAADARVQSRILRTATGADPSIHQFGLGSNDGKEQGIDLANRAFPSGEQPAEDGIVGTGTSTARGFGDITFRGKLAFMRSATQAAAFALDLQLPTGSTEEWIGLGVLQIRPALLWSRIADRVSVRVKADALLGVDSPDGEFATSGGSNERPFEIGFGAGFDTPVAPRTRLTVDLLGRQTKGVVALGVADVVYTSRGPGPLPSANFTARDELQVGEPRQVTSLLLAVGGAIRLSGVSSLNVQAVLPAGSRDGLRPSPTVVFSIDHGF